MASSFRKLDTVPLKAVIKKAPLIDSASMDVTEADVSLVEQPMPSVINKGENTAGENRLPNTDSAMVKGAKYKVAVDKTYFYTIPDESSKRKAYMVPSENALLSPVSEKMDLLILYFLTSMVRHQKDG